MQDNLGLCNMGSVTANGLVSVARERDLAQPKVLLIDKPTKGIDIGSKSENYFQLPNWPMPESL